MHRVSIKGKIGKTVYIYIYIHTHRDILHIT